MGQLQTTYASCRDKNEHREYKLVRRRERERCFPVCGDRPTWPRKTSRQNLVSLTLPWMVIEIPMHFGLQITFESKTC